MNRPSGPLSPIPLFFCSCANSEIGLLMCFRCRILFSAVVTVCLVPDTAVLLSRRSQISVYLFFSREIEMGKYSLLLVPSFVSSVAGQRHRPLRGRNIPVRYLVLLKNNYLL